MKKDIIIETLKRCELEYEEELNNDEYTITAYSDELQFEMYVIFKENEPGIEIYSPLTPEFQNVSDEVKKLINEFYEENESMVDLVADSELYVELISEDALENDVEYLLSEFLQFFAEEDYIDHINKIIDQIIKDNQ